MANRLLAQELEVLRIESELSEQRPAEHRQGPDAITTSGSSSRSSAHELGEEDERRRNWTNTAQKIKSPGACRRTRRKSCCKEVCSGWSQAALGLCRGRRSSGIIWISCSGLAVEHPDEGAAGREAPRASILDADHFGLEKVKERILEILGRAAACAGAAGADPLSGRPSRRRQDVHRHSASPGALNRKLARISLGGVHDEAEIRGHRKTYIGAMPGRIMTGHPAGGSKNAAAAARRDRQAGQRLPRRPVLRPAGGPGSANRMRHSAITILSSRLTCSECMFITTANTTETIPRALARPDGGHRARLLYGRGKAA